MARTWQNKGTLAALFILFIVPVISLLYLGIHDFNKWIYFSRKERIGVKYNSSLKILLQNVMHHRGMSNAYLSGDPSFSDGLAIEHSMIEADIRVVDLLNQKYGIELDTDDRWARFRKRWQGLEYTEFLTPKESFESHTAIINEIIALISHVGETSNLILDPEISTFYLMDCITFKLPLLAENIGQSRGAGTGLLARHELNPTAKRELAASIGLISQSLAQTNDRIEKIFLSAPDIRAELEDHARELNTSTRDFMLLVNDKIINSQEPSIRPVDYYEAATKAIDADFNLYDKKSSILDKLLEKRISHYQKLKLTFISVSTFISAIFIYIFTAFMKGLYQLEIANKNLRQLAITDPLTGIFNRLELNSELETEIERAKRYNRTFSLIMLDLDNFKDVNDTFGHRAGDDLLINIAQTISKNIRKTDILARWGGEEFIILLPETPVERAMATAEILRKEIENCPSVTCRGITASFGVTEFNNSTDDITSVTQRADTALYEAKKEGKNKVSII